MKFNDTYNRLHDLFCKPNTSDILTEAALKFVNGDIVVVRGNDDDGPHMSDLYRKINYKNARPYFLSVGIVRGREVIGQRGVAYFIEFSDGNTVPVFSPFLHGPLKSLNLVKKYDGTSIPVEYADRVLKSSQIQLSDWEVKPSIESVFKELLTAEPYNFEWLDEPTIVDTSSLVGLPKISPGATYFKVGYDPMMPEYSIYRLNNKITKQLKNYEVILPNPKLFNVLIASTTPKIYTYNTIQTFNTTKQIKNVEQALKKAYTFLRETNYDFNTKNLSKEQVLKYYVYEDDLTYNVDRLQDSSTFEDTVSKDVTVYLGNNTTLHGCPHTVLGNFTLYTASTFTAINNKVLFSLDGGPRDVGGNYRVFGTLQSLRGVPLNLGGGFECYINGQRVYSNKDYKDYITNVLTPHTILSQDEDDLSMF
jgi:hypothetical protein